MRKLLAISNSTDATVDLIEEYENKYFQIIRINTDNLNDLDIEFNSSGVSSIVQVDAVWYRRPFESMSFPEDLEQKIFHQETEEMYWNYFLQYPPHLWINYPTKNWFAERKLVQLTKAPSFNLKTPEWMISKKINEIKKFIDKQNGECLLKPIDNGYISNSNELRHIYSTKVSDKINLEYSHSCPTLFQKIIDKKYDVRTIFIDGAVKYFRLDSKNLDVRINEMKDVKYSLITPPKDVQENYKNFIKSFGLRFSTSDFVVDKEDNWLFSRK
jgi:hypothetical protein